jgi:anthranilate phosphoribosyltransferase
MTTPHAAPESDIQPPARSVTDTHDFAPYIRILGRGPSKSRSLTRDEARHALGMVLRGEATREQIGALLMLLRYRGEAVDEMAGLVEAARAHAGLPWTLSRPIDLDWPSYADGRTRGLPWYLLAALLLAQAGLRIVMHGPLAGPGRQNLVEALGLFGVALATDAAAAEASLAVTGFAFLPLESLSPELFGLLALRGALGLRSPLNTVCRLLDPSGAAASIDGVFHPAYIALHLGAAALLGRRSTVLKGGGGEAEWTGVKPLTVHGSDVELVWPALADAGRPQSQTPADMLAVWRGTKTDPAGAASVIATAAIALQAAGCEHDPAVCLTRARALWDARARAVWGARATQ